jgi:hypothetical protein
MKVNGRVLLIVLAMVVAIIVVGMDSRLEASQYLGESTWTLSINQDEDGPVSPPYVGTFKGCLSHVGGAYYTMQGYVAPAPDGMPILSGGGVLIGEVLYLTLTVSQTHLSTDREGGVVHLELAKTTLNGTLSTVECNFDTATIGPSPVFSHHYSSGTVTCTGPVLNLTPAAGVASNSLLLLD